MVQKENVNVENTPPSQRQAMRDASKEGRAPMCISCNHKVHSIITKYSDYVEWKYDEESKRYVKETYDGESPEPTHNCSECKCEYADPEFYDDVSETNIGVDY